jgi:hypothetical protein
MGRNVVKLNYIKCCCMIMRHNDPYMSVLQHRHYRKPLCCFMQLRPYWFLILNQGPSWPWSHGSWIYNYQCNQCLSLLTLRVRTLLRKGVLNITFSTIFQLYLGDQFYWWRKQEDPEKNHRPVASQWQTLSHNVVHHALIEIWTHNFSGDRHWLHR